MKLFICAIIVVLAFVRATAEPTTRLIELKAAELVDDDAVATSVVPDNFPRLQEITQTAPVATVSSAESSESSAPVAAESSAAESSTESSVAESSTESSESSMPPSESSMPAESSEASEGSMPVPSESSMPAESSEASEGSMPMPVPSEESSTESSEGSMPVPVPSEGSFSEGSEASEGSMPVPSEGSETSGEESSATSSSPVGRRLKRRYGRRQRIVHHRLPPANLAGEVAHTQLSDTQVDAIARVILKEARDARCKKSGEYDTSGFCGKSAKKQK